MAKALRDTQGSGHFFLDGIDQGANGRIAHYFNCTRNFLVMRNIHETRTTYAKLIRREDAFERPAALADPH